jgi:hypothetical protein
MSAHRLSRRRLLSSLGMGAAALPLLDADAARAAGQPRRLVVLQTTNGVLQGDWWPQAQSETSFTLGPTMAPLAPHKSDIVILRGLEFTVQRENKPAGVGAFGGHESLPFLLTGAPGVLGVYDGNIKIAVANAISLDWYLGTELKKRHGTPLPTLTLGAAYHSDKDHWRPISFRGPAVGDGFPMRPAENRSELNPYAVFDTVFGNMMPAGSAGAIAGDAVRARRKSLLDYVGRDIEAMSRRLGAGDRAKVQSHLEGVRQLENELASLGGAGGMACTGPSLAPGLNVADRFALDKIVPMQLKLIVAAFRCNVTQIATLQMCNANNNGIAFPFLGASFTQNRGGDAAGDSNPYWTHHKMAHNQNANDENRAMKNAADRWFVQQLADLIAMMKAIPEGGGTMLDNTVILLANNMGDGAGHWIDRLPWVLAGGCGGRIQTGRFLDRGPTPHNRLLASLANAVLLEPGERPLDGFGDRRYAGELAGLRS